MTREEIIKSSKILQFPKNDGSYADYTFPFDKKSVKLSSSDKHDRYFSLKENMHHYTTRYAIKKVVPTFLKMCGIEFNINDFDEIKRLHGGFDFSYIFPKYETKFHLDCYNRGISYDCNYSGLIYNTTYSNNLRCGTVYHRLYACSHECSHIHNYLNTKGGSVFISGDSQMIPSIRILSLYFSDVYYFDNRGDKSYFDYIKDVNFDHVIIEVWNKEIEKYFVNNLA